MSVIPTHGEEQQMSWVFVHDQESSIQGDTVTCYYVLGTVQWLPPSIPVSSNNKTQHHNITAIGVSSFAWNKRYYKLVCLCYFSVIKKSHYMLFSYQTGYIM